ncbi:MAG: hypothetical protein HY000_13820, partial [Planctomycetes bacterium]|nr:hypothetical protein [Planctomycetota bacterium]
MSNTGRHARIRKLAEVSNLRAIHFICGIRSGGTAGEQRHHIDGFSERFEGVCFELVPEGKEGVVEFGGIHHFAQSRLGES